MRRRPLAVAEHDRNQAVAAVLRAAGVGRLEGVCHLARIVTGQKILLVLFT